jgi:hypothetical protein
MVLTLVKVPAAMGYECQNRDTSYGISTVSKSFALRFRVIRRE